MYFVWPAFFSISIPFLVSTNFISWGMFWNIPIPGVYSWCFGASENPLGAEYIFLEKQAGFIMIDVWHSTKWKQKVHILDILDQVSLNARGPFLWTPGVPAQPFQKRLSALKNSLQVACHITSKSQATYTSLLWHDNLNSRNSFVNSEDPSCIIIIGNRQSTSAYIIMQIGYSELIITTVQSLRIWKDLFTTKTWCLRSRWKAEGKRHPTVQTLYNSYLVWCLWDNNTVSQAIKDQNAL